MKKLLPSFTLTFTLTLLLTGCASLFKAPTNYQGPDPMARQDSYNSASWTEARADQLESKGMSKAEARALANTEAAMRGR